MLDQAYNVIVTIKQKQGHSYFAVLLQGIESDFLIKIIGNEIRLAGIDALSVHDCLIVKRSDMDRVSHLVKTLGRRYTGYDLPCKIKPLTRQPVLGNIEGRSLPATGAVN